MSSEKCVVEGCTSEYDVTCSFSFYNVNTASDNDNLRQEWIDGAMQEESECLWRHVSLQLCGYHFELDNQGLWIDSPVLPELLTVTDKPPPSEEKDFIQLEHNYSSPPKLDGRELDGPSRLNVRQLVDSLGYLSLKNLQRKQLWVVKVDTEEGEANVSQTEQVITKMTDPNAKQIIEIIPPSGQGLEAGNNQVLQGEVLEISEETTIPDNFIYEIGQEQEIQSEEVRDIPYVRPNREWTVNIIPEETRPKYAFIKNCTTGKKKRHFTSEVSEVTIPGGYDNLYILPDADPSVGIEVTTSYESENYIVDGYQHLVLQEERPKKAKRKKEKKSVREQIKKIKTSLESDWSIDSVNEPMGSVSELGSVSYDAESTDEDYDKRGRVRRKNSKYLGYDFVT